MSRNVTVDIDALLDLLEGRLVVLDQRTGYFVNIESSVLVRAMDPADLVEGLSKARYQRRQFLLAQWNRHRDRMRLHVDHDRSCWATLIVGSDAAGDGIADQVATPAEPAGGSSEFIGHLEKSLLDGSVQGRDRVNDPGPSSLERFGGAA